MSKRLIVLVVTGLFASGSVAARAQEAAPPVARSQDVAPTGSASEQATAPALAAPAPVQPCACVSQPVVYSPQPGAYAVLPCACVPAQATGEGLPPLLVASYVRQAQLTQRLRLLTEQERELKRDGREGHSLVGPFIVMGVGFGATAYALAIGFVEALFSVGPHSDGEIDDKTGRAVLITCAVGLPVGFAGLAWAIYQVHSRPHREEVRELERQRGGLRRELKELRREERTSLSVLPQVSLATRSLGLAMRSSF
jgi:hypothetical protein